MTAQELIDIEKKYKERHNSVHLEPNQVGESAPDNMDEDIRFLNDGYIAKHYNPNVKTMSNLKKQGFDDFEILMLKCFLGGISHAFKWTSYEHADYENRIRSIWIPPQMNDSLSVKIELTGLNCVRCNYSHIGIRESSFVSTCDVNDIDDVVELSYELLDRLGLIESFISNGVEAIDEINKRALLKYHWQ